MIIVDTALLESCCYFRLKYLVTFQHFNKSLMVLLLFHFWLIDANGNMNLQEAINKDVRIPYTCFKWCCQQVVYVADRPSDQYLDKWGLYCHMLTWDATEIKINMFFWLIAMKHMFIAALI